MPRWDETLSGRDQHPPSGAPRPAALWVFLEPGVHKQSLHKTVVTCLFFQNPDSIQQKGSVMRGQNPNGVEVRGPDLLNGLEVVISVIKEALAVVAELEEGEPLHHDVGAVRLAVPGPGLRLYAGAGGGHQHRLQGHRHYEGLHLHHPAFTHTRAAAVSLSPVLTGLRSLIKSHKPSRCVSSRPGGGLGATGG